MRKVGIRHFLLAKVEGWSAPIPRVRFAEPVTCLSTSQLGLVRSLCRSINHSFVSLLLRVLLLATLCCSTPLADAEDAPPARLKYGAWGFDLAGMDTATKPGDDFFR
jgi:hypothetical protein